MSNQANQSNQEIQQRIIKILSSFLGIPESDITPASTVHDLHMDSLDEVEILMELEDEFGIEIDDEAAEKWETVEMLVIYVTEQLST